MHAMVLAAGLGTRLLPLTQKRPKCLMPVMNRPLLGLWLERLAAWGVQRTVINTHHLAGMVRDWTTTHRPEGPELRLSHEPEILGTGGGLVAARPLLGEDPFLLINADVLATHELPALLAVLEAAETVAVLGLVDDPRFNTVALDSSGRVLGFKGDPGLPPDARWLTYAGLGAISPGLLDLLPPGGYSTLVQGLQAAIAQSLPVLGMELMGFWDDLGAPERLLDLHRRLANGSPADLAKWAPGQPLLLGPEAHIAPQADVQGFTVLGKGAVIEDGASVKDSLLLPGARVATGAKVQDVVLGDGFVARGNLQGGAYA
jgi:mannose-1-phosphate guanylyltransferase